MNPSPPKTMARSAPTLERSNRPTRSTASTRPTRRMSGMAARTARRTSGFWPSPSTTIWSASRTVDTRWDTMIDVALKGVFLMSKHALPVMMRQQRGVILNTATVDALLAGKGKALDHLKTVKSDSALWKETLQSVEGVDKIAEQINQTGEDVDWLKSKRDLAKDLEYLGDRLEILGPYWAFGKSIVESGMDIRIATEDFENTLIRQALHLAAGNKNRAAALLGLKRTTFVEMLKRKSLDAGEAHGPVS